jgi:hypothetical protein
VRAALRGRAGAPRYLQSHAEFVWRDAGCTFAHMFAAPQRHHFNWGAVAAAVGRSRASCRHRWKVSTTCSDHNSNERYSDEALSSFRCRRWKDHEGRPPGTAAPGEGSSPGGVVRSSGHAPMADGGGGGVAAGGFKC